MTGSDSSVSENAAADRVRALTPARRDRTRGLGRPVPGSRRRSAPALGSAVTAVAARFRMVGVALRSGFNPILREEPASRREGRTPVAPFGPPGRQPTRIPSPGRGWGRVPCSPLRSLLLWLALWRALLEQPIAGRTAAVRASAATCPSPAQASVREPEARAQRTHRAEGLQLPAGPQRDQSAGARQSRLGVRPWEAPRRWRSQPAESKKAEGHRCRGSGGHKVGSVVKEGRKKASEARIGRCRG